MHTNILRNLTELDSVHTAKVFTSERISFDEYFASVVPHESNRMSIFAFLNHPTKNIVTESITEEALIGFVSGSATPSIDPDDQVEIVLPGLPEQLRIMSITENTIEMYKLTEQSDRTGLMEGQHVGQTVKYRKVQNSRRSPMFY